MHWALACAGALFVFGFYLGDLIRPGCELLDADGIVDEEAGKSQKRERKKGAGSWLFSLSFSGRIVSRSLCAL